MKRAVILVLFLVLAGCADETPTSPYATYNYYPKTQNWYQSPGSCTDSAGVHPNGSGWACSCNSCMCWNGEIISTQMACPVEF
ncbi:MAG: hypothetical protein R3B54_04720 [Bdellovibrionota bacterium]